MMSVGVTHRSCNDAVGAAMGAALSEIPPRLNILLLNFNTSLQARVLGEAFAPFCSLPIVSFQSLMSLSIHRISGNVAKATTSQFSEDLGGHFLVNKTTLVVDKLYTMTYPPIPDRVRAQCFDAGISVSPTFTMAKDGCEAERPRPIKPRNSKDMPLLLKSCGGNISYRQLLDGLYTYDFDPTAAVPKVLVPELAAKVLSYLTVERVVPGQVRATSCSSHDQLHPLSASLEDDESNWWLSQPGSLPGGVGRQYVQYQLCNGHTLCRLSRVSIKIPPLPMGPLSVRQFYLETFDIDRGWHAMTPHLTVSGNKSGWQTYDLMPCDVREVRLVCVQNQMANYLQQLHDRTHGISSSLLRAERRQFSSVGFYAARFE